MALGLSPQDIIDKGQYPLLVKHDSWERIRIDRLANVQNGFAFKSQYFSRETGVPLIRIRDIESAETENLFDGEYDESYLVRNGDILVGMDGDFKASRWPGNLGLLNQRVSRLQFDSSVYDESFFFYCLQPYLNAINAETSSVTVKHLSSKTIRQIPLPLPPLPEQRAIVAKLEGLFSELDNGIAELKRAQEKLKVYRQSVLKKAFEGELTGTEIFLDSLGEYAVLVTKGASPKWQGFDYTDDNDGLLFLTSENVRSGFLSLEKKKRLPLEFNDVQSRSVLKKGDVLFNIVGASIGRAAIFNSEEVANVNQAVALIRTGETLDPHYLSLFLNSEGAKQEYLEMSVEVARANLSLKNVREIQIPICSEEEQGKIVEAISCRFAACEELRVEVDRDIERAEILKQSILKRAFEGALLTEMELKKCQKEVDWCPASELLTKMELT